MKNHAMKKGQWQYPPYPRGYGTFDPCEKNPHLRWTVVKTIQFDFGGLMTFMM